MTYTREVEDWQNAPVSVNDQKLAALAAAYAKLCSEVCKDPMKCEAYRAAVA
jgi:hypothetical protein